MACKHTPITTARDERFQACRQYIELWRERIARGEIA